MNWDDYYLGIAAAVAKKSKDPSTKVGAVLVRPNNTVCSLGFNGFPRGIEDDERLDDREAKMKLVIHAEMNAILTALESTAGCTLYIWPWLPCSECAKHVVQAGIRRVVTDEWETGVRDGKDRRWNFCLSLLIFEEAGVEVNLI